MLARQAAALAELHALRQARDAAARPPGDGEGHWRQLFEKLSEGFVVGEVVRGNDGRVVDWTYLDVNAAWTSLIGVAAADAIGRSVRDVIDGVQDEWIDAVAAVIATGEPRTFTRTIGPLGRSFEGHAFHLDGDRFAMVFVEVTDRARADRRQAALLSLGDHIRDLDDVDAIIATGSRMWEGFVSTYGERK